MDILLGTMFPMMLFATSIDASEDLSRRAQTTVGSIPETSLYASANHLVENGMLFAEAGDDNLCGCSADDLILGTDQDTRIFGGNGEDILASDQSEDFLLDATGEIFVIQHPVSKAYPHNGHSDPASGQS